MTVVTLEDDDEDLELMEELQQVYFIFIKK